MNLKIISFFLCFLLSLSAQAYHPFVDNESFFLQHLKRGNYSLDTTANAIVLYEYGAYKMYRKPDGQLYFNIYTRRVVKILSSKGISEADISIPYPSSNNIDSRPVKIVGKTYSLDGSGKVSMKLLDDKVISINVINDYYKLLKFSLPAVTEGCVIDYTYEIDQPATITFVDWRFQDMIPVLHSELSATYLNEFQVATITKSSVDFKEIADNDILAMVDSVVPLAYKAGNSSFSKATTMKWVRRNLPAIIEEPYLYNIEDNIDRLDMYVVGSPYDASFTLGSWPGFNKMMHSRFALYINAPLARQAIRKLSKEIFTGVKLSSQTDSAKHIYNYVRNNYKVTEKYLDVTSRKPQTVIDEKKGTSAEINLLLFKLLEEVGIKSNFVMIATREAGKMIPECPVVDNVTYMVCRAEVDGRVCYLDPTEKYNPFGVLSPSCYNGMAWVVDDKGYMVNIAPDSLRERTSIVITTENSAVSDYTINIMQVIGHVAGAAYRKEWINDKSKQDEYIHELVKSLPFEGGLLNYEVKNINDIDDQLKIAIRIKLELPDNGSTFFNPSIFNYYDYNPFMATMRTNPVELPYAIDYNYMINLTLPEGYSVSELPSSFSCKLDDKNTYRYMVEYREDARMFSVVTRLSLANTYFDVANYGAIQTFFNNVIAQQSKPALLMTKR